VKSEGERGGWANRPRRRGKAGPREKTVWARRVRRGIPFSFYLF